MILEGNMFSRIHLAHHLHRIAYCFSISQLLYEAQTAGEAGRHIVGCLDLFIDIFLEVQNKRYSQILYLIDQVVPGLHFWYKN